MPILVILGFVLVGLSGLVMFGFQIYWFLLWWGPLGVLVGVFVPPLAVVFPFIYLLKEGFSLFYFGVWLAGIVGMAIAAWAQE